MKVKKEHKCKSIKEYKGILNVFNWKSAMRFNGLNCVNKDEAMEYLRRHPNKRFGVKVA